MALKFSNFSDLFDKIIKMHSQILSPENDVQIQNEHTLNKEKFHPPEISLLIGIIGCIGGLFIQLVIGALYQWGIISLYITSYYRLTDDSITV